MTPRKPWTTICGVALLFASCSSKGTISGAVEDNFGKPLDGVQVTVSGTSIAARTGRDGRYEIDYVPGAFSLRFEKQGYGAESLPLTIATKAAVPAATAVMWKDPPSSGMSFIGSADYVPMLSSPLTAERMKSAAVLGFNEAYSYTSRARPTIVKIAERAKPLRFVDREPSKTRLLKVIGEPHEGLDHVVLVRGLVGTFSPTAKDVAFPVKEEERKKVSGFVVRSALLEPGAYAFVSKGPGGEFCDIGCEGMPFGHVLASPVYLFRVE